MEKAMLTIKRTTILVLAMFLGLQLQGRKLLDDLDLSEGRWEMVGVSLANYKLLDIQLDLGTFIVKDPKVIRDIQDKWDFEEKFDDYCDYHYALKFYKNGDLQKTLRVNLVCNYITDGGLSYEYNMDDFMAYRRYFSPIRWSRIRFKDVDLLKKSVPILDQAPGVYWYGDVQQYNFDGEFSITVNKLPWNADRDSVIAAISNQFQKRYGREDFYITTKYWLISDDFETMTLRLNVFCDEDFFVNYQEQNVITRWRDHFSEQSFVQLVVIGMNQKEYYQYMRRG